MVITANPRAQTTTCLFNKSKILPPTWAIPATAKRKGTIIMLCVSIKVICISHDENLPMPGNRKYTAKKTRETFVNIDFIIDSLLFFDLVHLNYTSP
jgi:hypothetical protein